MNSASETPKYSFIIPIYNEEETIPELYHRVSKVMTRLDGLVELILVNDGSWDKSLKLIRELHQKDPRVSYLSLARNFGHQTAVTAGLNFARGQVVVILDADLQDPPELILLFTASLVRGRRSRTILKLINLAILTSIY